MTLEEIKDVLAETAMLQRQNERMVETLVKAQLKTERMLQGHIKSTDHRMVRMLRDMLQLGADIYGRLDKLEGDGE